MDDTKYLYGASIIIGIVTRTGPDYVANFVAEGIMALTDPALRDLYDLKVDCIRFIRNQFTYQDQIFVQADSDLMLARRIQRDVKERGRSVDGILEQYDFSSARVH